MATILAIAIWSTQSHNYYVLLHWFIFLSSIYLAYRTKDVIGLGQLRFGLIFFSVVAILFNPFMPFTFSKTIWRIIDIVLIAGLLLFLNIKGFVESLSQKGKLNFKLFKSCFWGCIALLVALWLIFYETGNPYNEFLLITKSTTANGFITSSEEQEDVVEPEGRSASQVFNVYYEYHFTTKDGKTVKDHGSDTNPKSGYLSDANEKPIPIVVEYIPSNPQINRIKDMTLQCKTITEFIWRRLALGGLLLILGCSIGISMIKKGIKEFVTERKNLTSNILGQDFVERLR